MGKSTGAKPQQNTTKHEPARYYWEAVDFIIAVGVYMVFCLIQSGKTENIFSFSNGHIFINKHPDESVLGAQRHWKFCFYQIWTTARESFDNVSGEVFGPNNQCHEADSRYHNHERIMHPGRCGRERPSEMSVGQRFLAKLTRALIATILPPFGRQRPRGNHVVNALITDYEVELDCSG